MISIASSFIQVGAGTTQKSLASSTIRRYNLLIHWACSIKAFRQLRQLFQQLHGVIWSRQVATHRITFANYTISCYCCIFVSTRCKNCCYISFAKSHNFLMKFMMVIENLLIKILNKIKPCPLLYWLEKISPHLLKGRGLNEMVGYCFSEESSAVIMDSKTAEKWQISWDSLWVLNS